MAKVSGHAIREQAITAAALTRRLRRAADPTRARLLQGFFKTGPGQYGEGDRFLGLRLPAIRALARESRDLPLDEIGRLLASPWHEARLLALVILADAYAKADPVRQRAIYRLYISSTDRINNWDLVDVSAPRIVGAHLFARSRAPLARLAKSTSLWERRIAILATLYFITRGEVEDTLAIARTLLDDRHDLIHKAVGWMLREVGKRNRGALEGFLHRYAPTMPRTALRYAIERFSSRERRRYLAITRRRAAPSGVATARRA